MPVTHFGASAAQRARGGAGAEAGAAGGGAPEGGVLEVRRGRPGPASLHVRGHRARSLPGSGMSARGAQDPAGPRSGLASPRLWVTLGVSRVWAPGPRARGALSGRGEEEGDPGHVRGAGGCAYLGPGIQTPPDRPGRPARGAGEGGGPVGGGPGTQRSGRGGEAGPARGLTRKRR